MIGVTDEQILDFHIENGGRYPVMRDSGTYNQYDAVGASAPFPLDVVVDQNGVIAYVDTRFEPDEIERVIDELLGR